MAGAARLYLEKDARVRYRDPEEIDSLADGEVSEFGLFVSDQGTHGTEADTSILILASESRTEQTDVPHGIKPS
jgi:hypothetical protein